MRRAFWHYLNANWGLFWLSNATTDNPTIHPEPIYFVTREFIKALPPESQIVGINDDNTIAAIHKEGTQSYLSLIIYNGDFTKKVPTACPSNLPCGSESGIEPADSFAGDVIMKDSPQALNYQVDLTSFGIAAGVPAEITILEPDMVNCPINNYTYLLQGSPSVSGKLYYGGCSIAPAATTWDINATLPSTSASTAVLTDNNGVADPNGRMGLRFSVPAHTIYFVKIPIPTLSLNTRSWFHSTDDAGLSIASNAWSHQKEATFQYWADANAKTGLTDSGLYTADTFNQSYTETTSANATVSISFNSAGTNPDRMRVYGVHHPNGGPALVTVDGKAQYMISTYGEYWLGNTLLFDTGPLPATPGAATTTHTITITNLNAGVLVPWRWVKS